MAVPDVLGRRAALKFQALVDSNGQRWPEGWVKGVGFATVAEDIEPPPEHPLLVFGTAYVRRLTSAGPDTQTKYVQQLTSLSGWLTAIKRSAPTVENVTSDDDRDWIPEGGLRKKVSALAVPHARLGKHVRFSAEHLASIVSQGEVPPVPAVAERRRAGLSPRSRRTSPVDHRRTA